MSEKRVKMLKYWGIRHRIIDLSSIAECNIYPIMPARTILVFKSQQGRQLSPSWFLDALKVWGRLPMNFFSIAT
jgi:hypothetical protein